MQHYTKVIPILILTTMLHATEKEEDLLVRITPDIGWVKVRHMGKEIKVMRIQDTASRLTDDYTKTSRPCPPFCIHPTRVDQNIETIAEVEMMHFLKEKVTQGKGLVVDARLQSWYELETIPSAVNIPYTTLEGADKETAKRLFRLLGMQVDANGKWDFSQAKALAVFCNGVWCDQSHRLIDGLLKFGYPARKIYYYRSGFQGWKLLGLTTVVQKENIR